MLKTFLGAILTALLALSITGCSDKEPTISEYEHEDSNFECKQENVLAPKWTCIPRVSGAYAGVGIAEKSSAGMGHMRRIALANGRSDLAQQIKSQVKDKVETFTRTTGVDNSEVVDQVNTSVSKQVAKVDLQGSKGIDTWNAPSGALYMLVVVSESNINTDVKNSIKTSFRNDDALWQQFQAKNALESLDNEFPTD